MKLTQEQDARLKMIELDILKAFLKICEENQLQYFLAGGTLLGAVRHKGFIPWDDDIDVVMPRADYDRFLEIGQNLLPTEYFLQTRQTDVNFPCNFAKIRDNRTTFVEKSLKNTSINHGVYIDVFPMDYFPGSRIKQCWKLFWWKLSCICVGQEFYVEAPLMLKQNFQRCISRVFYGTPEKALKKRENMMCALKKGPLYFNYCGAWCEREIAPVVWYGEGVEVEFEGLRVKAPENYHAVLTRMYGNYLTPPPPEKQIGHHFTDIIDLDRPYTEYIKSGKE